MDHGVELGGEFCFAVREDAGPGGVEKDVADAGIAVEEDGNAAGQGFYGGDAVALDGGHQKDVGVVVEGLQLVVGDETVELDAVLEAQFPGAGGHGFELGTFAGQVEAPVGACGEWVGGLFQGGESFEDPVDAFVGLDAGDGEEVQLRWVGVGAARWLGLALRVGWGWRLHGAGLEGVLVGQAAHAGYFCVQAEVLLAFLLEEVAGDDHCATAAAHGAANLPVGEGEAETLFEGLAVPAEEAGSVVHEAVEASGAGEGAMKGGLVAGRQGWRVVRVGGEVLAERGNLGAGVGGWVEFEGGEWEIGVLGEVDAVVVGEEIDGVVVLMEPAAEGEDRALGAAHGLDLRHKEGNGLPN